MVSGVSFDDHDIGVQTRQLVSFEAVVLEQLAASNPLTPTSVSFKRRPQAYDRFMIQLRFQFGFCLAFRRALFNLTPSMVSGVSFEDHEIGVQTRHSVPTEAVVLEQLAASNPLTSTLVSLNGLPKAFDGFTIKLRCEFGLRLAFRQPDHASEHAEDGENGATNGERLNHFTALREA